MRGIILTMFLVVIVACDNPTTDNPKPAKLAVKYFMAWNYPKSRICQAYIEVVNEGGDIARGCNAVISVYDSLGRQVGYKQAYFCVPLNLLPFWEGVIRTDYGEYPLVYSSTSYPTTMKIVLQPGVTEEHRQLEIVRR